MTAPDPLVVLAALVAAHSEPQSATGTRLPIMYVKHLGGHHLDHHALADPPAVDDAVLEELSAQGYLDIDYRQHNWNLTPTAEGRQVVEQHQRVLTLEPDADVQPLLDALAAQAQSANKLAWPAVRPVLGALRSYWEAGGFSPHGIQLPALLDVTPDSKMGSSSPPSAPSSRAIT